MAEVIKFEWDQPVEVALRFTEPKVFGSNFPGGDDRHMFSTTDGRVMYLDPLTAAKVKSLGVEPGELFSICKRKQGRITDYLVFRESDAAEPPPPPAAPAAPRNGVVNFGGTKKAFPPQKSALPDHLYHQPAETELEQTLRASIDMVERKKLEARMNQLPPAAAPSPADEFTARLVREASAIVDAYAQVLHHASEKYGNAVKGEDVRSILLSAYINASKAQRA